MKMHSSLEPTQLAQPLELSNIHPVINGKWRLLILYSLRNGPVRYGQIRDALPAISEKVLVFELKDLVSLGAIERTAYKHVPPHVDYRLTKSGSSLIPLINHLQQINREWETTT